MQEMTTQEMDHVNGGVMNWREGAAFVAGLSMYSPVTMAFGFPIAGAMLYIDYLDR
jgi:hypothetical protein